MVVDHFSRRPVGFAVFLQRPTAKGVNAFLGRTIRALGGKPRYVITDKGKQFWCNAFEAWCRRRHIRPRFGAVGKYGSIAAVERFIRKLRYSPSPGSVRVGHYGLLEAAVVHPVHTTVLHLGTVAGGMLKRNRS